jgi:hypothetical protein
MALSCVGSPNDRLTDSRARNFKGHFTEARKVVDEKEGSIERSYIVKGLVMLEGRGAVRR